MILINQTSATPNQVLRLNHLSPLIATGTVSITTLTTTVTGVSTLFLSTVSIGDRITIGAVTARVVAIASNTVLTIDTPYSGATQATQPYTILINQIQQESFYEIVNQGTATIFVGESMNALRDGTDVTATNRSVPITAGTSRLIRVSSLDLLFAVSAIASQVFSINSL